MSEQLQNKENLEKNQKPNSNKIFLGCMFVGIGLGFLFEHMPA